MAIDNYHTPQRHSYIHLNFKENQNLHRVNFLMCTQTENENRKVVVAVTAVIPLLSLLSSSSSSFVHLP